MKARPLLMSAPMVRALLDGSKTQTRRIIKPQPIRHPIEDGFWLWFGPSKMGQFAPWVVGSANPDDSPFQEGMRLWVRESFANITDEDGYCWLLYADGTCSKPHIANEKLHKTPSIFMPRWASRITLEITDVRVERLQDISEADALAEGIHKDRLHDGAPESQFYAGWATTWDTAKEAYAELWDSINGAGSWKANPFVWVINFKRVEVPA